MKKQTNRQPDVPDWEGVPANGPEFVRNYPKAWMWCLHCHGVFQAKDLIDSNLFPGAKRDACPLPGCHGCGLGVDVFIYGTFGGDSVPVADLAYGKVVPMYPEGERPVRRSRRK